MVMNFNPQGWRAGLLSLLLSVLAMPGIAQQWDHQHTALTEVLKQHVHSPRHGGVTRVDYAALKQQRTTLDQYLNMLTAVPPADYASFTHDQQKAFLINAYNAFTLKLILDNYPGIDSIKDIGGFFSNPWKQRFIPLLGKTLSLDDIEHERLRKPGVFDDPRIHFAVNCASLGCPSLRAEAYSANIIDQQLDQQALRFMSDRSRNRYNSERQRLEVSKIFDWYGEDFSKGYRGIDSLEEFLASYSEQLADDDKAQNAIRAGDVLIRFTDYDWGLNDIN